MNTTRKTIFALTLTASLVVAGAVATGQVALLSAEPTAVAVVDWTRVMRGLEERAAIEQRFQSKLQELRDEGQQRQERIQRLQQELQGPLGQAAEDFHEKQAELQEAAMEHEVWAQFQQRQVQVEMAREVDRMYRKMLDMVDEIAQDIGYDIVMNYQAEPQFRLDGSTSAPQALEQQIRMRSVIYAAETADITEQVVQRMNTAFEAGEQ